MIRILKNCNIELSSTDGNTNAKAIALIDIFFEDKLLTIDDIKSVFQNKLSTCSEDFWECL